MAEGNGAVYNNFKADVMNAAFNLGNGEDEIKVMLVCGYTPDIDADTKYSDVSAYEATGTGYTAGGEILANQVVAIDSGSDLASFDADNPAWSSLLLDTPTPSHAISYDNTHADKLLIAYWELGRVTNGGDYTIQWSGDGVLTLA